MITGPPLLVLLARAREKSEAQEAESGGPVSGPGSVRIESHSRLSSVGDPKEGGRRCTDSRLLMEDCVCGGSARPSPHSSTLNIVTSGAHDTSAPKASASRVNSCVHSRLPSAFEPHRQISTVASRRTKEDAAPISYSPSTFRPEARFPVPGEGHRTTKVGCPPIKHQQPFPVHDFGASVESRDV